MKHFNVTAKCGHVGGIDKFILIDFYTTAETAKEAAAKIRQAGRVQHDKKDAIQFVKEVTREEYLRGRKEFNADPYNRCSNPQEQKRYWDSIAPRVQEEEHKEYGNKNRTPNRKRAQRFGYYGHGKVSGPRYEWDDYCA